MEGSAPVYVNLKNANFIKAPTEMREFAGEIRFTAAEQKDYLGLIKSFASENELINQIPEERRAAIVFDQCDLKEVIYRQQTDLRLLTLFY